MKDYLIQSIEEIKKFFNKYVITFSSFLLVGLINDLNKKYYGETEVLNFLNMKIHPEYFSLILGVLIFVFIVVLYFKFSHLRQITDEIDKKNKEMLKNLKFIHWIASPFNTSKWGIVFFVSFIAIGVIYSIFLGFSHLFLPMPDWSKIPLLYYKAIGVFNTAVFFISAFLLRSMIKYIWGIRNRMGL